MLTVACVFVRGNVPYSADYVHRLWRMVLRHIDRPFAFVCLTDQPKLFGGAIQTRVVPSAGAVPGWWSKLRLFDPQVQVGVDRVLYLDLDTLIVDSLTPIVDFPSRFALVPPAGDFTGRDGLKTVRRYNSSVMVWQAGEQSHLWTNWTPAVAQRLWGDQDWIGEQAPKADTMPAEWFPRLSDIVGPPRDKRFPPAALSGPPFKDVKVILSKKPKNEEAAKKWPWFAEAWR